MQESQERAIGQTLANLQASVLSIGLIALGVMAVVLTALWAFVARALASISHVQAAGRSSGNSYEPGETMPMIPGRPKQDKDGGSA